MQWNYNLEFILDHRIAIIDGKRVLIDTGHPSSFGPAEGLSICGTLHKFNGRMNNDNLLQMDALLGNDFLSRFPFLINWKSNRITFYSESQEIEGIEVQFIPGYTWQIKFPVTVKGNSLVAVFDSGSTISWIAPEYLEGLESNENGDSHFPHLGLRFTCRICTLPIEIGGFDMIYRFGSLPAPHSVRSLTGGDILLGTDILNTAPLYIDYGKRIIKIVKNNN